MTIDLVYDKKHMGQEILIHALSRGVDKRKIFIDEKDYFRFIHDLFEFNDEAPADNASYHFRKFAEQKERKPRKLLVDIHAFCLMPNHYHLLLSPRIENGISKFMKKLNMGYARYFNEKYDRSGALFEGRYKSVLIEDEKHFIYIPYYIHLNPLDLKFPEWREGDLKNYKEAMKFLENYRWSSFQDYIGKKNFPSVTQREFLLEFFEGKDRYKENIFNYLKGMGARDTREYKDFF